MFSKINIYLLKNFILSFIIVFSLITILIFFSDLIEQFRKATNKNVPIDIIFRMTTLNIPSLSFSTLPIVIFFSTVFCYLKLIRESEYIIMGSSGISSLQLAKAPILMFFFIGLIFVFFVNPLSALFQKDFQELDYKYMKRIDRMTSISKNGIWLMQENSNGITNIIYAKNIEDDGSKLINFMLLEYDSENELRGRIDGKKAKLIDKKWLMNEILFTKKDSEPKYYEYLEYSATINKDDIKNSLSAPEMMSFLQLGSFIYILEKLGYSANDYKIYFYNILFMPIVIIGFVLLANAIVIDVKQNDKFTQIILFSFLLIFIYYFFSNLMNTLGANSKINPLLSSLITPTLLFIISIGLYRYKTLIRKI
ncbi:LptF/LptG family permease [Pelagibacteraceae bacterium]|nr:LptF/LptG family permease [Pelagibacteraceae bacterium]